MFFLASELLAKAVNLEAAVRKAVKPFIPP
jgi:hypothetical protein